MKSRKTQIFFVNGGSTHHNNRAYQRFLKTRPITIEKKISWNDAYLDQALGPTFHIIRPRMPLQDNAKYQDWAIHFERFFPKLKNNLILIGQSLGGGFLAKYLSENKFPRKILSVYLVCPPFDDTLPSEHLAGGFKLKSDLSLMEKNAKKLYLLFSKNDDVIPVVHAAKYAKKLPNAKVIVYKHIKGHFRVAKFPEIVRMIKRDARR
ncbi:MAG: alpha/beta hydrolase [Patescibacteria group bacterium]|nr:alpha/beta hydrolase [Patescibacteria group bacterium]MDD5567078.1 alpha/beta hydrolase [Patescibacteria group bacterium]